VQRILVQRAEMAEGRRPVDWGTAEALAFATLLQDGTPIRFAGQDARRGTFNHRHALLVDYETAQEWLPLEHLSPAQPFFEIHDTALTEEAALAFEYGFSRGYPDALVCWEAQFGDFANGAQIIIDQFLAGGEDKWGLLSGLVVLLPHGFEGQGPEHSSARIERFLQLAAEDNMQICQPTTAAQYFHLLRRQALRRWRKPLVVFTPKGTLRTPGTASPIEDFARGRFEPMLPASPDASARAAKRLLVSGGKLVHELAAEKEKRGEDRVVILRLEQLYPFPERELETLLAAYPRATEILWVQEEPANMGALAFVIPYLERHSGGRRVSSVKRSASASPATGSMKAHGIEQRALIELAFAGLA
jgi:2-oxoglutarate dehydrogenase E1 component